MGAVIRRAWCHGGGHVWRVYNGISGRACTHTHTHTHTRVYREVGCSCWHRVACGRLGLAGLGIVEGEHVKPGGQLEVEMGKLLSWRGEWKWGDGTGVGWCWGRKAEHDFFRGSTLDAATSRCDQLGWWNSPLASFFLLFQRGGKETRRFDPLVQSF